MTTLSAPAATRAGEADREPTGSPRFWWHAVALLALFVVLVPFVENGYQLNADEGAVLLQADVLVDTGGWSTDYPAEALDPQGEWYPVDLTERVGDRWFPYTKRIVYPLLVAGVMQAGGLVAVNLAHALAAWAAVVLAALAARRVAERWVRADVATLWCLGVASPIFFDVHWVMAHAFGALGAAAVAYGLARRRTESLAVSVAWVAAGLVVASAFRSEGTLLGLAVTLALAGGAVLWRRRDLVVASGVALAATAGSYVLWGRLDQWAMGSEGVQPFRIVDGTGWLEGRWLGFENSMLRPQIGGSGASTGLILLLVAALGAMIAGIFATGSSDRGRAVPIAAVAIAAATARVFLPPTLISGFLIGVPAVVVLAVVWVRRPPSSQRARLLGAVAVLLIGAVLALQYASGGGGDWSGRYFRMAVPLLAVAGAAVVARIREGGLDRPLRAAALALFVVGLAWNVVGIRALKVSHEGIEPVIEAAVEMGASTVEGDDPAGPVIVADSIAYGRFAWRTVRDARYLGIPEDEDLPRFAERAAAGGVDDLVMTGASDRFDERVSAMVGYEVAEVRSFAGDRQRVAVLRRV